MENELNQQNNLTAFLYGSDCLTEKEEAEFSEKLANDPRLIMNIIAQASEIEESLVQPSVEVRKHLFEKIFPPTKVEAFLQNLADRNAQALVVSDPAGVIEWVSPAFTRMCGYTLEELRGNQAGKMLQGAATNPANVNILRDGIRNAHAVKTHLVNYHKSGDAYEVDIRLSPIHGETGELVGFVAVEYQVE